ncbi:Ribonuclease H-like protein [Gracilaria domingensis]|nr:Ribonuclease H-like protein [Gracilaria domingensis]
MTVSEARSYAANMAKMMTDTAIAELKDPNVWCTDPLYSEFFNKKENILRVSEVSKANDDQINLAQLLLTRFIVDENLPFSILDKRNGRELGLAEYSLFLRSSIPVPSRHKLNGLIDKYYCIMEKRVRHELRNLLYEGFATLMFDSSEDVNGSPMTNLLARTMGKSRRDIRTFFLCTVYTGHESCAADHYMRIAEKTISEWIGIDKLVAVVTDNTESVKKARESVMNSNIGVVASQDQAHVADRLMADIGEIDWIDGAIKTVSAIAVFCRRHRRLKPRLLQKMKEYNAAVSRERHSQIRLLNLRLEGYRSLHDEVMATDEDEENVASPSTRFVPEISLRSKTMKIMSNVRFASAEKLLR